ncbi:MAG: hypothetical protein LAO55_22615 [Acidobacteriia bacterium]|nr:hypothetical protein [Terriglobia bacterium]
MKKNNGFLGSMAALVAAAAVAAVFVIAPVTGQDAPTPGGKGGGGFGGKGGGKQAVPAGPVPRTAEGKPDMSGFWGGVQPGGVTSIEPAPPRGGGGGRGAGKGGPPGGGPPAAGPGGGAPGGPAVAGGPGGPGRGPGGGGSGGPGGPGGGGRANSIVDPADGKVPYTVAARAKSDDLIANGMYHEPELHCFMSSVPHNMWVQFGQQTIQTKDYVVFTWEFMHSRRIIPLDNRPHQITSPAVHLFQGESVGHWEGDTLVVDTTNQNDKTWFDTSGHYKPQDAHVVERFTMTDSNTIEYEANVTSAEFTQPMVVKGRQTRANANDPNYEQMEFACIEGNEDVKHYTEDKGGKAKNVGARTQ